MSLYEELFEMSKLLLAEEGSERSAETLLRRLVERQRASREARLHRSYRQKLLARQRIAAGDPGQPAEVS